MKRNIYLLLLLPLFTYIALAQEKKTSNFVLKGTYIGKHAHAIFLTYKESSGKKTQRKVYLKNGIFSFKGFISSPVYAGVTSDIKITPNGPDVSNYVDIFLSPGNMTISLTENDFEHAVLSGSPVQDEWMKMQTLYKPINKIRDSLYRVTFAISSAGNTPKNHIAVVAVGAKIDKCNLQIDQVDYRYISSHPQSYLSAYLLNNFAEGDMRLDSIEMFYNKFSQPVKKSVDGEEINKVIANRKASIVGRVVRMPLGTNIDGSRFNPQTFKINNYVLFYFWAGWANDNADLKPVYNKYKSRGLKILAVSTEPFKKIWRDSVKKEKIEAWYNIFSAPVANLDTFYSIRQMAPSLVLLIDKNHKIIGRYRGRNKFYKMDYSEEPIRELDKKLAKLIY
ncbi:DUF4369 domain-containing protein [Mucilaginibacter paludis]|uniref:DUF4369 domain-containing protein n=1 Tax=Mucilaginibacter paludis DSM 18603 TaxID=714943 RepID=H1YIU9_9SPHI|nr:DUF4369 domain-containing protein [Mucilaginibacter paludis]EHQ27644.1 hypothetical protein Mucpa_3546 [Mucilaginibacter paludis DSM 18603]